MWAIKKEDYFHKKIVYIHFMAVRCGKFKFFAAEKSGFTDQLIDDSK